MSDIVSIKVYRIGDVSYAIYATTTGIVLIPTDDVQNGREALFASLPPVVAFSHPPLFSFRFVPHNTMQGDLADFIIRTDLPSPELHVLTSQVKGEIVLRYNMTQLLMGASDRACLIGEPRFITTNLVGELSMLYHDGFTYATDVCVFRAISTVFCHSQCHLFSDGNVVRYESQDPSVMTPEESWSHGCRGSSSTQFDPLRGQFYFACTDAKLCVSTWSLRLSAHAF